MARASMWQLEGYPVEQLTQVDWDGMTMEWESGGPNLFYLSASVVFAFGGPRDATALMRDLVRLLGLGRHGHSPLAHGTNGAVVRANPVFSYKSGSAPDAGASCRWPPANEPPVRATARDGGDQPC